MTFPISLFPNLTFPKLTFLKLIMIFRLYVRTCACAVWQKVASCDRHGASRDHLSPVHDPIRVFCYTTQRSSSWPWSYQIIALLGKVAVYGYSGHANFTRLIQLLCTFPNLTFLKLSFPNLIFPNLNGCNFRARSFLLITCVRTVNIILLQLCMVHVQALGAMRGQTILTLSVTNCCKFTTILYGPYLG